MRLPCLVVLLVIAACACAGNQSRRCTLCDTDPRQPDRGAVWSTWASLGEGALVVHHDHDRPYKLVPDGAGGYWPVAIDDDERDANLGLQIGASLMHRFERDSYGVTAFVDLVGPGGGRYLAGTVAMVFSQWMRMPWVGPTVLTIDYGVGAITAPDVGKGVGFAWGMSFGFPVARQHDSAWLVGLRGSVTSYLSDDGEIGDAVFGDVDSLFTGISVERVSW
jgi:hypothetical protein